MCVCVKIRIKYNLYIKNIFKSKSKNILKHIKYIKNV